MNNPYYNSSVLVTGAAGFIGSHLVEKLVQCGARITALDNLRAGKWSNLASVEKSLCAIEGDVRDASFLQTVFANVQPQYVFHLAANASVPGSVEDPVYDFEANCVGTFEVLNAARLHGRCQKVVCVSSGAVYGEPLTFPISEENALKPISPYGASKLSAEVQVRMFHRVYGTPGVIARLFNAYGPRMARFVVLDFLRKLKQNPSRLEILGSGRQIRDFTYVADTVQGLMALAEKGAHGEAYNVSSGTYVSVTDLAHRMVSALGLTGKTEISFTGESWVGDAQRWEVSIDKISALGFRPEVSLENGLAQTIGWFNDRG